MIKREKLEERYAVNNPSGKSSWENFLYYVELFFYELALFSVEALALLFLQTEASFSVFLKRRGNQSAENEYSFLKHQERRTRVHFFTRSAFACILISTLVVSSILYLLMPGHPGADAATFTFTQSLFDGGADTVNFPKHPDNRTDWDKYFAKDENVSTGNNLTLSSPTNSWTQSSDGEFGAAGASYDGAKVTGSGVGASVTAGGTYPGPEASLYAEKKGILIQNNVASLLADYQVKLTLDTAALVAAGKLQEDCDDLRFTESDGTALPYWLESGCNTTSTIVWIKTSLAASATKTVYLYAGNGALGSGANGSAVFDFFDDFSGASLDAAKWDVTGTGTNTLSGGILTATGSSNRYVKSKATFGTNFAVRANLKSAHLANTNNEYLLFTSEGGGGLYALYSNTAGSYGYYKSQISNSTTAPIQGWAANTYGVQELIRNGSTSGIFRVNNANQVAITTNIYAGSDVKIIFFMTGAGSSMSADWVLVRKYAATEPTASVVSVDASYVSPSHLAGSGSLFGILSFSKTDSSSPFPAPFSAWQYRKPLTITNGAAQNLTDYQVKLTLDTSAPGRVRGDCGDLRFSEADGTTSIPYWYESGCGTTSTIVWLKTSLTASSSKTVYWYYGNPDTASGADGNAVFELFDDFSGTVLNTSKWRIDNASYGTVSVSGGNLALTGNSSSSSYFISSLANFGTDRAVRARVKAGHGTTPYHEDLYFTNQNLYGLGAFYSYSDIVSPSTMVYFASNGSNAVRPPMTGWITSAYGVQDIIRNGSTSGIFRVNDANEVTASSYIYTGSDCKVRFRTLQPNASVTADWVLVRKYNSTEPTAAAGSEERGYSLKFQLRSADTPEALASAAWYGPTGTGDYYITSGTNINPIHNGNKYVQYRTFLGDAAATLNDLTITIDSVQTLTSSPYDIGDVTAVLSDLRWTQTTPDGNPNGNEVRFQLRAAPGSAGAPGEWTEWMGPDGTSGTYYTNPAGGATIPVALKTSVQWIQYKLYLKAVTQSPTVDDITLQYTLNAQPQVGITSAAQGSDGVVQVAYTVSDSDLDDSHTAYVGAFVNTTLNEDLTASDESAITVNNISNFPVTGTILVDSEMIAYTGKSGSDLTGLTRHTNNTTVSTHATGAEIYVLGAQGTGLGSISDVAGEPAAKTIAWSIAQDVPGIYLVGSAKIRVAINDGNGAFQLGSGVSSVLDSLDTKAPAVSSIVVNGALTEDNISLNVTDDDAGFLMKYSTSQAALDSLAYGAYAPTVSLSMVGQPTAYFRFIDNKSNVTNYSVTIPAKVTQPLIQDISNTNTGQYRLFFAFTPIAEPAQIFQNYHIFASASGAAGSYSELTTLDSRVLNYYLDTALTASEVKYYRVQASDKAGNRGEFSDALSATSNGYEDVGEGNGGGGEEEPVLPVITHDPATQITNITNSGATITFTADQISDSAVLLSTDTSYGKEQGVPTMIAVGNAHTVVLTGLVENTAYYYKLVARDALGNKGELENSATLRFTTTTDTTLPAIQNPVAAPADTTAVITCKTDKAARLRIDYGADTNYGAYVEDTDLNIDHTLSLTGLTANTTYHYRLTATDGTISHNQKASEDATFTTATLPAITFVRETGVTNITATRATFAFSTNKNTNSLIDYSKTEGVFTSTQGIYTDSSTTHTVTLSGLDPETTYYFRLRASDGTREDNEEGGETGYSFITLPSQDKDAPVISTVAVGTPTGNSATVTWTTDEPSSSLVDFGPTLSYGRTQGQSGEKVTSHSVTLTGLAPATAYRFKVKSTDENGNLRTDDNSSAGYAFTTAAAASSEDAAPPVITFNSSTGVSAVTTDSATISWTTDEDADGAVGFSLGTSYSQEKGSAVFAKIHTVTLTNLSAGHLYRFRLKSQDAVGNMAIDDNSSQGYTFTTLAGVDTTAPGISAVSSGSVTGSGAVISWTTDEASSSVVEYGLTSEDLSFTAGNLREQVTSHTVTLSGLSATTKYYFRVRSEDAAKNVAMDSGGATLYSFTTLTAETVCPVYSGGGGGGSSRDTTGPQISAVKASNITATGMTVTWTTNESSYSMVECATDAAFKGSVFWGNPTVMEKQHSVVVVGLLPDKQYHYRVLSADASGNLSQGNSLNLTTDRGESALAKPEPEEDRSEQVKEIIRELQAQGTSEEEIKALVAAASRPPLITSEAPRVSDITNASARISWRTDKKTNSVVKFRVKGGGAIKEFGNFNESSTEHAIVISNLEAGVTYEYQVQSSDVLGNTTRSDWYGFVTLTTPSIFGVYLSSVSLNSATIEWKTNVPASEQVEYGHSLDYSDRVEGVASQKATAHLITLNNLESGKTYHYRIKGIDVSGNILSSDDYTLTTFTLPKVESYALQMVGEREAVLRWATNVETDSSIKYTDNETKEAKSQGEDALAKSHEFKLKGLEPGKSYILQIQGRDAYGNQAVSPEFLLNTSADTTAPAFGRVNIETAISSGKGAQVRTIVSYSTSEPSTTQLFYKQGAGDNEYAQSTALDENLTTNHVVIITDFKPATVYKFRLQAKDAAGNRADSQDFTVLVPAEKKSVIQMITSNFENTFGWLKKIKR